MTVKLSLKDLTKKKIEQQTSKEIETSSLNDEKVIKNDSQNGINEENKTRIVLKLNKNIDIKNENSEATLELEKTKLDNNTPIEINLETKNKNLIGGTDYDEITSKIEIKKSGGNNSTNLELFSNYQSEFVSLIDKEQDKKNNKDIKIIKKSKKIYFISSFSVLFIFAIFSTIYFMEDIKSIIGSEKNIIDETIITPEDNINTEIKQEYNSPLDEEEIISGTGNIIETNNNNNEPIIEEPNIGNEPIINDNIPKKDPEIKKKADEKIMEIYLKKTMIK